MAKARREASAIRRVAVGLLWQETNSFNPYPTAGEEFVRHRGEALIEAYQTTETSVGGIIRRLGEHGIEPVPAFAARARPGGPIPRQIIDELIENMVRSVIEADADAVCLELHGSMAGQDMDDVEGELLETLRRALGPDITIAAALDLHGHVTQKMVDNSDILTGYRTHPHIDMAETGRRAVDLMLTAANIRPAPVPVRRTVPMLALWRDETSDAAMRSVLQVVAQQRSIRTGVIDVSVFNTHPFLDLPGMGQVVLAYGSDAAETQALADAVAAELWRQRDMFSGQAEDLADIFSQAGAGLPLAIGDQGDSVLAGAPGDSVEIARFAALHAPEARGLLPVFDPAAVETCISAGVNSEVALEIGGKFTPGLSPLSVEGTIVALTDGFFLNQGAYMRGVANDLGATAIVRSGARTFVLASKGPAACDPALAAHAGLALEELDYLVVKSSNHFRLSLADVCECSVAATPGLTARRPDLLPHRRARPLYPIDKTISFTISQERLNT